MVTFEVVPVQASLAAKVVRERRDDHGNVNLSLTVADSSPGFPCRVCLEDAAVGESLVLFSYCPFPAPKPYRTVGPIFVHARACTAYASREIPGALRRRLLSLRAYDGSDRMVGCEVVEGRELEAAAQRLFALPGALNLHVHNARPGCFACVLRRLPAAGSAAS